MLQRSLIPKTIWPHEIAKIKDFLPLFSCLNSLFSSGMTLPRSWWVVRRAHIQAFTFFHCADSQDHGRLPVEHISKHSHKKLALTLKITVGCLWSTYSSIRTKTCTRVGLLGPRGENWRELETSRVATKHCAKHCAEISLCQHFLRPSHRKKRNL